MAQDSNQTRRRPLSLRLCRVLRALVALSLLCLAEPAPCQQGQDVAGASSKHKGRPRVRLDQLVLPPGTRNAPAVDRHLRTVLRRETRRADWGAGKEASIEYRFHVRELAVTRRGNVLRVSCTAVGELPGGRSARSQLSFGGSLDQEELLVHRVLEIVARGVVTRLAELERARRTAV